MMRAAFMQRCTLCRIVSMKADPEGLRMDWDDFLPFALAIVAAFALALKAVFDARRVRRQLAGLTEKFWMLDHRLVRLNEQMERVAAPPGEAAAPPAGPTAPEAAPPIEAAVAAEEPGPVPAEPAEAAEAPALAEAAVPPAAAAPPGRSWEQVLVEHWLVWLGGATIALGGAFLVKLSIDYGLLTPPVRVVLAILLGIALSVGSEWVLQHEPPPAAEPD